MKSSGDSQRGYSLLEALIAVAILAALATALAPAIHAAVRASSRILAFGRNAEDNRIAQDALSGIFGGAVNFSNDLAKPSFVGDESKVTLVSITGVDAQPQRVELSISQGRLYARLAPLDPNAPFSEPAILLSNDASAFSFYGRETSMAPPDWRGAWRAEQPPRLVRIERLNVENIDSEPALEFRVGAEAPLHCLFDPVSRRCRT